MAQLWGFIALEFQRVVDFFCVYSALLVYAFCRWKQAAPTGRPEPTLPVV